MPKAPGGVGGYSTRFKKLKFAAPCYSYFDGRLVQAGPTGFKLSRGYKHLRLTSAGLCGFVGNLT